MEGRIERVKLRRRRGTSCQCQRSAHTDLAKIIKLRGVVLPEGSDGTFLLSSTATGVQWSSSSVSDEQGSSYVDLGLPLLFSFIEGEDRGRNGAANVAASDAGKQWRKGVRRGLRHLRSACHPMDYLCC
nr:hypothetical protein Iba_chr02cCG11730 [Ipomoea batatas]